MPSSSTAEPIAVTMGEPAGIGGELTLKAWLARETNSLPAFFAIDDPARLEALRPVVNWPVPIERIDTPAAAAEVFPRALPVLAQPLGQAVTPGRPDPRTAHQVVASIDRAVDLALAGAASAVVTNPIQKKTLYEAGFTAPGHTEHLAERCARAGAALPAGAPMMLLAVPELRVALATIHIPLAEVPTALARTDLGALLRLLHDSLTSDFGLARPRIAVAGLNPHAGEDGAIGSEEGALIAPAIAGARADGLEVTGPHSADTLFHPRARERYDAALCMYHDQGLIPLKTLDFDRGVNVTLGLPIVRTSPDHGTALDIAGKGTARPDSLIAAIKAAEDIAAHRRAARR